MQREWGGRADLFFARRTLGPQQPVAQDGAVRLTRGLPAYLDWGGWQSFSSEGLYPARNLDCRSTQGQNTLQSFCCSCDILLQFSLLLLKHLQPLAFWPKAGQDPFVSQILKSSSTCVCVSFISLTVRFGGDPQGGGALPWPYVVVGYDPEAVALLWFQVGHCQLQWFRLWHIHWPLPNTGKNNLYVTQCHFLFFYFFY